MKFPETRLPATARDLTDLLSDTMLRAPRHRFPDHEDFDGVFYAAAIGVDRLRKRFGDELASQLLEMLAQAKAHYEAGENGLGGALMEDTKMLVMRRQPWAYPKELFRWALGSSFQEVTASDLLNRDEF